MLQYAWRSYAVVFSVCTGGVPMLSMLSNYKLLFNYFNYIEC